MRDNTSTARLEDTPTPEQDLSTAPEPDFEFQEGLNTLIAYAALPQVVRVIPGAQPWHLTLELDRGEPVNLSPDCAERASLHPGEQGIGPLVIIGWPDQTSVVYAVPAALLPELLPFFPGLEEQP